MQWATCPLAMCNVSNSGPYQILWSKQAYTSQIAAMTMMALALGEDTLSSCSRREAIIEDLFDLPSNAFKPTSHLVTLWSFAVFLFIVSHLFLPSRVTKVLTYVCTNCVKFLVCYLECFMLYTLYVFCEVHV